MTYYTVETRYYGSHVGYVVYRHEGGVVIYEREFAVYRDALTYIQECGHAIR